MGLIVTWRLLELKFVLYTSRVDVVFFCPYPFFSLFFHFSLPNLSIYPGGWDIRNADYGKFSTQVWSFVLARFLFGRTCARNLGMMPMPFEGLYDGLFWFPLLELV
jgi:hypothetical protein